MITDTQTNKLYLADCLPTRKPEFYKIFEKTLIKNKITFEFLPETKDIWAVDFMPIQTNKDRFVKFYYDPDYLEGDWKKTISDSQLICDLLSIKTIPSDKRLDGGNVIRSKDKVIMCDKVFKENKRISKEELTKILTDLLEVEKIIFIPQNAYDYTGHADGMVRFLDSHTVLVNDYSQEKHFQNKLLTILKNEGLECIPVSYNPLNEVDEDSAIGIYINYLQMNNVVLLPIFGNKEDEIVVRQFEGLFKNVDTINSCELASEGGILNCISWNILV